MRQGETAITIGALLGGLCGATFLVFSGFVLSFLAQLLSGGQVAFGWFLFVTFMALSSGAFCLWALRAYVRAFRPVNPIEPAPERPRRPSGYAKQQEARACLLSWAKTQDTFDMDMVMRVTELERIEAEYLIDSLIQEDVLKARLEQGDFLYRLVSTPDET